MISSLASKLRKPSCLQDTGQYTIVFTPSPLISFSFYFIFLKILTLHGVFMKVNIGGRQRLHLLNSCEILQ